MVVKNTVPPSSVADETFRSPVVRHVGGHPVGGLGNSPLVGSLKVVNQPSIFWILFTRLPPPELYPVVKLAVLPVVLTFVPSTQLVQVTMLEELKRLLR